MTQLPQQQPMINAKPQADIYSLLLIVAILALATTIGFVMWNLMSTYGLEFEEIFKPL